MLPVKTQNGSSFADLGEYIAERKPWSATLKMYAFLLVYKDVGRGLVVAAPTGRYAAVVKVTAMRQEVAASKSGTEGLDATIARSVRVIPACSTSEARGK